MPHAIQLNGQQVVGFDSSRAEDRITDGWILVTLEQFAAAQVMAHPMWDGSNVVEGPEPIPVDPLAYRAAALLSYPTDGIRVRAAVLAFLGQVQALAQAGVSLPSPLTFAGIAAAIKTRWPNDLAAATAAGLELRTAWDGVVYHCGTLREADDLFPYLAAEVSQ